MPRRKRRQRITPYQVLTIFVLLYFFMILAIVMWKIGIFHSVIQALKPLWDQLMPNLPNSEYHLESTKEELIVGIIVITTITGGAIAWILLKKRGWIP